MRETEIHTKSKQFVQSYKCSSRIFTQQGSTVVYKEKQINLHNMKSVHTRILTFIKEIIDSISLFFLWQCHSEFVILGLTPWDDFSCSFVFGWWWKFSWFPSLLWNCWIYTFLLPFVISILDFIFTWIPLSDIPTWILKPILVLEGCSIKKKIVFV